ncbi:MAG: hypothetical protein LBQ14_02435 [Treponema sp.]|jgi:hypothetical protein|nr:hypothetical protein [Treponema sp.]
MKMKTMFLAGMIVLLSVSSFFLGCSSDDSTDPGAAAAAALVAGNTDLDGKVTVSGGTIILNQNITLTGNLTIPVNVTLMVSGSNKITLGGNALTIESGGTLRMDNFTNNLAVSGGSLKLEYGSTMFLGGNPAVGFNFDRGWSWDSGDPASELILGSSGIDLDGKLIFANTTLEMPLTITSGSTLTIKSGGASKLKSSGGTLTVENGGTLVINGALTGDLTDGAPSIIIESGGIVSGSGNLNIFYPNGSTTAGAAVAGKTYTWTGSAGGSGVAGWKAGS